VDSGYTHTYIAHQLRAKHGLQLQKVKDNKAQLKTKGTAKSWMEVFVLMNEDDPKFTTPIGDSVPKNQPGGSAVRSQVFDVYISHKNSILKRNRFENYTNTTSRVLFLNPNGRFSLAVRKHC
jgi:hypothetical protein